MRRALFGELLAQFVGLSDQDICEILEDQSISHRRFGEIAMAFQLCRPQDVWQAWWAQLGLAPERVMLMQVGVDTQALAFVPQSLAESFPAIPIRAYGEKIVLAVTEESHHRAQSELPSLIHKDVHFVLADEREIRQAIGRHYARRAG